MESNSAERLPTDDAAADRQPLPAGDRATPGSEFPVTVYASVIAAFAWMIATAWLAFATADSTDLDLAMVTVLAIVFFAIPLAMHRTAVGRSVPVRLRMTDFLQSHVDTATGPMPARQAWLEVMLIPLALAIAATLIGGVYILVG